MRANAAAIRECLRLRIAGIGIELTWEGAHLAEELSRKFYEPFLSNGHARRMDVRLEVHCGELPHLKSGGLLFDGGDNRWRLFHANGRNSGRYVFEIFDPEPPHAPVQHALLAPDFRSGQIYRRPDTTLPCPSWSLMGLMRPFGELLVINLLSQGRGVLVHASGVSDRGEGLLFVGASGTGKTTLANLYKAHEGVTVLGDERVIVTKDGDQFWLSGTPWPGTAFTVSPDTVPLRKVFFLEHGPRNALIADRLLTLSGRFFQQLFLPFWNGEALAFALGFGEELLKSLPASRLRFVNDARVIEFLRTQV